jgi:hypothetical protein
MDELSSLGTGQICDLIPHELGGNVKHRMGRAAELNFLSTPSTAQRMTM